MKLEIFNSGTAELVKSSEVEGRKVHLLTVREKFAELEGAAAYLNDEEIEYFLNIFSVLINEKIVFTNFEYDDS